MRIVFMGTPECAAGILSCLLEAKKDVVAVISRPDKPTGRGLKVQSSKVSALAKEHNLPVYKPENVRGPGFIKEVLELEPDLIIVVAYGKILPKEFLDIPKYGCINVHASLLPKYRGASPVQAALLNGDKETGITIMKINERLDAGDIIAQEKIMIEDEDNATTLTDKLFKAGAGSLLSVLSDNDRAKGIGSRRQDESLASYCATIKKTDGIIDFSKPAEEIRNKIRAFTPWPGAICRYKGTAIKLLDGKLFVKTPRRGVFTGSSDAFPGRVMDVIKDQGVVISAGDGSILITQVQPENSKAMSATEFARGYRIKAGDSFIWE